MKKVLFVCTGNTCRSPMAEYMFKKMITDKGLDATAKSAGTAAFAGDTASQNSVEAMKKIGIDLTHFRSSRLTDEMLKSADLIVAIGSSNAALLRRYGYDIVQWDISDPYGADTQVYEMCRDEIAEKLEELERLL